MGALEECFLTFAGLCRIHSLRSTRSASCGTIPRNCLGHQISNGGGGLSSAKSSTLVYGVGGGGGGVHHWHAANKESNLEFIVGGGGVLCYNIRAENMICCLGWEQVGGRGELTIFFLILVLSRCGVWDMSEKWQCVDLSCAGKQG